MRMENTWAHSNTKSGKKMPFPLDSPLHKKGMGICPSLSHVGLATGILFFDEGAGFTFNDLAAGSCSLHIPGHGGPFGDEPLP